MATAKQQGLLEIKVRLRQGGGEKAIEKQHSGGKQTVRERLVKLFDEGSFVETGCLSSTVAPTSAWTKRRSPPRG